MSKQSINKYRNRDNKIKKENPQSNTTTASFEYKIFDKEVDYPAISFSLEEYNEESLHAMTNILVQMSQKNFVPAVLSYIKQNFVERGLSNEFDFIVSEYVSAMVSIDNEQKEVKERPCIEPKDLV